MKDPKVSSYLPPEGRAALIRETVLLLLLCLAITVVLGSVVVITTS